MFSEADNLSGKAFSDDKAKNSPADRIDAGRNSPGIFQRIAAADMNAVRECIDNYGNLVWGLAKKLTGSISEAEAALPEIFLDIWKHADRFDESNMSEKDFVALIAWRYLIKRKNVPVSGAK